MSPWQQESRQPPFTSSSRGVRPGTIFCIVLIELDHELRSLGSNAIMRHEPNHSFIPYFLFLSSLDLPVFSPSSHFHYFFFLSLFPSFLFRRESRKKFQRRIVTDTVGLLQFYILSTSVSTVLFTRPVAGVWEKVESMQRRSL